EMARVFAGFNGTALLSLCMAAIDDESGVLFGINAGHPATLLYRNGQLNRLPGEADFGRLGVDLEDREQPFAPMTVFALQPDDVLLTAPRARENATPDFAALAKQQKADASAIFQALTSDANLSDDISLVRVQWDGAKAGSNAEAEQGLTRAREMAAGLTNENSGSAWQPVIDELQKVLQKDRFNRSAMNNLTRLYYRVGDYQQAAILAEQYARHHPDDTEFLLLASVCLYKSGRDDKARDFGERLKVRRPDHIENLQNLIFLANRAGDVLQAQSLEAEIEMIRNIRSQKAGALLN
ncbi:MAG: tetratricopeptide repeat protein, partial [Leptospiraceae bacterium]|nr:tetratricopeptide repeat protein [Leptospiraceae bacterium]